jgi:hypothetical protein
MAIADEDGYLGPATLVVDERELPVEVELRGHFQPIDGRYRWYGRVRPNAELTALVGGKKRTALLRTPDGEATGELSDPDPWDRYRITGSSTPPFTVPTTLAELESELSVEH